MNESNFVEIWLAAFLGTVVMLSAIVSARRAEKKTISAIPAVRRLRPTLNTGALAAVMLAILIAVARYLAT